MFCDFSVLATLSEDERRNGYAEVVKHAIIGDKALLSILEKNHKGMLSLDTNLVEEIVYRSLKVKTGIVASDEREEGMRRKLNFGHTIGHALERVARLSHGEAISIGMVAEARLSERRGLISREETERITRLLAGLGLPVGMRGNKKAIMDAIMKDKKREAEYIHSVLLTGLGGATVEMAHVSELEDVVDDLC